MPMDENVKLVQTVKDETQDPLSAFSVFQGASEETKQYFLDEFKKKDELDFGEVTDPHDV